MHKIVFIDEQKEDIDDFLDYVEKTSTKESFEIIVEYPVEDLDEMIQLIIQHGPDAIITDYMLNESKEYIKYNIPYNGVELVNEFLSIREGFPCFVMTSYDDQAISSSEDVNIVYIKGLIHNSEQKTGAKANFLERVESQIMHYKSRIETAEKNIVALLDLRKSGTATLDQESELIELDQFLESSIDKRNSIPAEFKVLSNEKMLGEMLSKVDLILKRLDDEK